MSKKKFQIKIFIMSFLVIIGLGVLIRLGVWQLERLDWRKSFNLHYIQQINAPTLNLNQTQDFQNIASMEYRNVQAIGKFDFSYEVYLQNQVFENIPGYHVMTPLIIDETNMAVLVDRGWIAMEDLERIDEINHGFEDKYFVGGVIRSAQKSGVFGTNPDREKSTDSKFWMNANLEEIQKQIPYKLLPVYIQAGFSEDVGLPLGSSPDVEITEGPHMGYAMQWFFFAVLLGVGYPFYLRKVFSEGIRNVEESEEYERDY
jgi:surfeit locus 1 family protein